MRIFGGRLGLVGLVKDKLLYKGENREGEKQKNETTFEDTIPLLTISNGNETTCEFCVWLMQTVRFMDFWGDNWYRATIKAERSVHKQ